VTPSPSRKKRPEEGVFSKEGPGHSVNFLPSGLKRRDEPEQRKAQGSRKSAHATNNKKKTEVKGSCNVGGGGAQTQLFFSPGYHLRHVPRGHRACTATNSAQKKVAAEKEKKGELGGKPES